jgi:hypothetical protein
VARQATHLAGAPAVALHLLPVAEAGPLDKLQRAQVDLLRGQIAVTVNRSGDAAALLLNAATQLEPLDTRLARDAYRGAYTAAVHASRLAGKVDLLEVARAVRDAPPASQPPGTPDLLLNGMTLLTTEGYPVGVPPLKQALHVFHDQGMPAQEQIPWLFLACRAAQRRGDRRSARGDPGRRAGPVDVAARGRDRSDVPGQPDAGARSPAAPRR